MQRGFLRLENSFNPLLSHFGIATNLAASVLRLRDNVSGALGLDSRNDRRACHS
jgi:hypothetical protein